MLPHGKLTAFEPAMPSDGEAHGLYAGSMFKALPLLRFARVVLIAAFAVVGGGVAMAGQDWPVSPPSDASPWQSNDHSRIRLIRAAPTGEGTDLAGLQFALDEGWHTYWRSPGAFGIPPTFSWEGSVNVRGVEVRWPEPQHITSELYEAYGYEARVVLPLVIARENPDEPAILRLGVAYAVCETVCMPATGFATIMLPAGERRNEADPQFNFLVREALALVPVTDPALAGLTVERAHMVRSVGAQRVLRLTIHSEDALENPRVIIEGPKGIRFGAPKLVLDPTRRQLEAVLPMYVTPQSEGVMGPALRATITGGRATLDTPLEVMISSTVNRQ